MIQRFWRQGACIVVSLSILGCGGTTTPVENPEPTVDLGAPSEPAASSDPERSKLDSTPVLPIPDESEMPLSKSPPAPVKPIPDGDNPAPQ